MAYCPNCGAQVAANANFCSYCGTQMYQTQTVVTPVQTVQTVQPVTYVNTASNGIYSGDGYAVMLVDCGRCASMTAADLLSDICGYTDAEGLQLVRNAPVLVAQSLNRQQAVYLAQALTEYGMNVAIYDRNGSVSLTSDVTSVFDSAGSFIAKAATTLGLLGIGNRITNGIRRLILPKQPPIYTMPKPAPRPPVRRHSLRQPQPRPIQTRPAMQPRPAAQPKPVQQPRPANQAHSAVHQNQPKPGNQPGGVHGGPQHGGNNSHRF